MLTQFAAAALTTLAPSCPQLPGPAALQRRARCMAHNNMALATVHAASAAATHSGGSGSGSSDGAASPLLSACGHLRAALAYEPTALAPAFNLALLLWDSGRREAAARTWLLARGISEGERARCRHDVAGGWKMRRHECHIRVRV
jgi:hypothetical protein